MDLRERRVNEKHGAMTTLRRQASPVSLPSLTPHQWELEGGNPSPCFPVAQALQLTLMVYWICLNEYCEI